MYKLEIYDGIACIQTLLYIEGEEMEIRDKIDNIKSIGLRFRLWKGFNLSGVVL